METEFEVQPPQAANGHKKVLKRLSALDRVFEATGTVTIQCGANQVTLEIQSVDLELVASICKPYLPKPKVHVELVNGKRTIVENRVDSEYQAQMDEYNRVQSYVFACCALMIDIEDKQGRVVWSADNSIHEVEAARRALKDSGMVDAQVVAILTAASNLTQAVEEQHLSD
jgi:hypothetical protein